MQLGIILEKKNFYVHKNYLFCNSIHFLLKWQLKAYIAARSGWKNGIISNIVFKRMIIIFFTIATSCYDLSNQSMYTIQQAKFSTFSYSTYILYARTDFVPVIFVFSPYIYGNL